MPIESTTSNDAMVYTGPSQVVECLSALMQLTSVTPEAEVRDLIESMKRELPEATEQFLERWRQTSPWSAMKMFDLLLAYAEFKDISEFVTKIDELTDVQFLYYWFELQIPEADLRMFLENPEACTTTEHPGFTMFMDSHSAFLVGFFKDIATYRTHLSSTMMAIAHSTTFQNAMMRHEEMSQLVMEQTRLLKMPPLQIAEHLMGKQFRRVSAYRTFRFIPSLFIAPRRLRVFDANACYVIFGYDAPDPLEVVEGLEKKTKALADGTRLRILRSLSLQREYGARLAEQLGLTGATISHHLDILKQAGFIREERVGTMKVFSIHNENVQNYLNTTRNFLGQRE